MALHPIIYPDHGLSEDEGAWAKLADGWPSKVAKMIANFNKSSSMMSALEKRQTVALIPQLKLLDWNEVDRQI